MTVQRFVWVVVAILAVAVAFTGGLALGRMSAGRVAFAGYQYGPGMMRGTTPFGNRMMPGYRGNVPQFAPNQRRGIVPPNNRGNVPQVAPNQRRGAQPPSVNPQQRPNPNNRLPNPNNRFPRRLRGA